MAKKSPIATCAVTDCSTKEPSPKKPLIPDVIPGQLVFLSVCVKEMYGQSNDCSPYVFATREAAQADCDENNKTRAANHFVVREQRIR